MATQRSSLFNMLYTGGFGITLLIGPNLFFGANGIAPYFLSAPTAWSEWFGRGFGAILMGMASGYFFDKDSVAAQKQNMIAHCCMLPLMLYGASCGDKTFNVPIWQAQIVMHLGMMYVTYLGTVPEDKKKK